MLEKSKLEPKANSKVNLSAFMIKKMQEKPAKSAEFSISLFNSSKENKQDKKNEKLKTEEELTKEKELDEAKKTSKAKAANYNQSDMIKKIIMETLAKYAALIIFLIFIVLAAIYGGPIIGGFLNGLIFKTIMGSMH
jgi:uncharacterized membrane protein YdfJ with MMPL/SSD domain